MSAATMTSNEMAAALRHCVHHEGDCRRTCPYVDEVGACAHEVMISDAADMIEWQQSELELKDRIIKGLQENSDANYRMRKYWEDVAREHWDSINVLAGEMCRLQQEVERLIQEDVELRRARLEGNV